MILDNITIRDIPRNLLEQALRDPGVVSLVEDILRQNSVIFPANIENAQETADNALYEAVAGFQPTPHQALPEPATQPSTVQVLPDPATQPAFDPSTLWPVGSIYISVASRNPGEAFGFGTWSQLEGLFLVGYKAGDPDFGTAGAIGGDVTAAISPHAGTAVADHPAHTHDFTQSSNAASPDLVAVDTAGAGVAASGTTGVPSAILSHTVTQPADHDDIDILPPYLVVYMWRRDS